MSKVKCAKLAQMREKDAEKNAESA